MKIEVIRRTKISDKKTLEITCSKVKERRKFIVVSALINGELCSTKSVLEGSASVSTALGKFIQHFFQDKIQKMSDKCSDIKVGKRFIFNPCIDPIYGIYLTENGDVFFHERIGMKQLKAILSLVGIDVDVTSDISGNISKIVLSGDL